MSGQARLVSPSPGKKLARQRRTAFLTATALVAGVAIVCCIAVLSGQGSSLKHNPGPAGASGSPTLTDQEYAFARNVVRHEIRRIDAVLTSATVTVSYGTVTDSNVGYPCMSGRLLNIKLIGDFPHTITTGHPPFPGDPNPDFTVHADVLTVDAKTGRVCLIGVQAGKVAPDPGAVSLPFDWRGFLGTSRLATTWTQPDPFMQHVHARRYLPLYVNDDAHTLGELHKRMETAA